MIALDKLIKNFDEYTNKYKLLNCKADLKQITDLYSKYQSLQKQTEEMRANCNKLCGEIATIKNKGKDVGEKIKQINTLDAQITKNKIILKRAETKLNKKLGKLPNLPTNTILLMKC